MENLQEQYEKAKQRLEKIQTKIDDFVGKELLPEQRKKYEGKYFTYDNGFGGDSPRWKVYYKVLSVEEVWIIRGSNYGTRVRVFMFQEYLEHTTRRVEYGIETVNDNMLESPSTKKEFDRAWAKLVTRIQITEP